MIQFSLFHQSDDVNKDDEFKFYNLLSKYSTITLVYIVYWPTTTNNTDTVLLMILTVSYLDTRMLS